MTGRCTAADESKGSASHADPSPAYPLLQVLVLQHHYLPKHAHANPHTPPLFKPNPESEYFETKNGPPGLWGILTLSSTCGLPELPGKCGILAENVAANLKPEAGCEVKECVWGEPGTTTPWGAVTDMGDDWDYIVGSDLIYSDESTPALLQTFLRSCGERTEIIMSMELRRKEDLNFYKRLVEVGFEFEKVRGDTQA